MYENMKMYRDQETLNDELKEVDGGESEDENGMTYYCNTCNKMLSYKAAKKHKDEGHNVTKMWVPGP